MSTSSNDRAALAGKYLAVGLAGEAYAIAVLKIREIIRVQKITSVPQMPAFVRGVINLRGRIIPVTDLRIRLGLPAEFTPRTCIVVTEVTNDRGVSAHMGFIVDSVEEVVVVTADAIEETPDFGTQIDDACLLGLAKINECVRTLLDIDQMASHHASPAVAA